MSLLLVTHKVSRAPISTRQEGGTPPLGNTNFGPKGGVPFLGEGAGHLRTRFFPFSYNRASEIFKSSLNLPTISLICNSSFHVKILSFPAFKPTIHVKSFSLFFLFLSDGLIMPSYRRGYSRGYRAYRGYRRYRRYRRYYRRYGGYARKFANGSSKSSIRVKVPMTFIGSVSAGDAGIPGQLIAAPWGLAGESPLTYTWCPMNSPLYQLYTQLYEEVKCIGIKAKIAINTPIGSVSVPSLQILTAWDRRLTYTEAMGQPTWANLSTYSTQQAVTAVNNSIAKLTRSCYASDLMEKAQWHDCSLTASSTSITDAAAYAARSNPNFFSPALWIAFRVAGAQAAQTISFTVEYMYYFAFRNPKYGSAPTAAKSVEMRAAMAEDAPLDTEEILDEGTLDEVPVRTKTNPLSVDGVHKSVRTLVGAETTKMRAEARRKQARETVRDM